jgi:hypothetical protein
MQNLEKAVMYGSVIVAGIAAVAPDAFAYFPLVLVVLGLVAGFTRPIEDVSTRVAYYVLAAMLPYIADNLDVVPTIGTYASGFLDQLAVFIAGVAIANVFVVLVKGLQNA